MKTSVPASAFLALIGWRALAQQPTPLRNLLDEANRGNPEILAAQKEAAASTHIRAQVTSLPDPQFTLQEFSVGSPRPGAGLSNNNFAYAGIGASQELPYPGKLRLKGAVADASAAEEMARIDVVRSKIAEQIKNSYLRLAYLQYTLTLLNASRSTLTEIIDIQLAQYSSGQGSQTEILKAQLNRTKLLRELTMHHQQMAQLQADLKSALNRSQTSPDIVADELAASPLPPSITDLLQATRRGNPSLIADARTIAKQQSAIEATRLAAKPDFSVGYMFQRTGLDFPAYYMATLTVVLPRRKRIDAERAEASERLSAAMLTRDAHLEQQIAEAQKQYAALTGTEQELKEFSDGILPQAEAAFNSTLAGVRSNKQTLDTVLNTLDDIFQLKQQYAQALFDHETALIRLETLSTEPLR